MSSGAHFQIRAVTVLGAHGSGGNVPLPTAVQRFAGRAAAQAGVCVSHTPAPGGWPSPASVNSLVAEHSGSTRGVSPGLKERQASLFPLTGRASTGPEQEGRQAAPWRSTVTEAPHTVPWAHPWRMPGCREP